MRIPLCVIAVGAAVLIGCQSSPSVPANAVHVFILAGQSNMEGQGVVDMDHPRHYNGGKGNLLQSMVATPERYAHLKMLRAIGWCAMMCTCGFVTGRA